MSTKILLADDSITIQKVIGIIFGSDEYSLTIVDNGKAALEKALEISPDILLIDALMPGVSGYEVCARVKATPALASKPVLLLTGSFEPFDETKAKTCGADDFIAKPFESQQIIAKVTELCERGARAVPEPEVLQKSVAAAEVPTIEPGVAPVEDFAPVELPEIELEAAPAENLAPAGDMWEAFAPSDPPLEETALPVDDSAHTDFGGQTSESLESPWMPIDENTLGLTREPVAAVTRSQTVEAPSTEEFAFETSEPEPVSFPKEAPVARSGSGSVGVAPVAALSEEQLKAAIATLSKDVIERIVWEVVPDLAETMIRKALREITGPKQ